MDGPIRRGNQRVCAVCARVLDKHENTVNGEITWIHSAQDEKFADHPPVPVFPDEIIPSYRCDFCNSDQTDPGWVIPAKDFQMPGSAVKELGIDYQMSDGDWGACNQCAKLISENRWGDLITRVIGPSSRVTEIPRDVLATRLARMYHRLRQNMTGPPYRLHKEP